MSTLYVRDASGFREVKSFDALERAQALLSQRFPRHDRWRLGPSARSREVRSFQGGAAVLLYHNHVSGQSSPSAADETITRHIQQVLATLDVKVVDHLVIAAPIYSFAEHGRL